MNLAHLGAGIGMGLGAAGTGIGIGLLAARACEGTARQPEAGGLIRTTMITTTSISSAVETT